MIRFFALLLFIVVLPLGTFAQTDDEPVVWEHHINKISDSEYELVMEAKIFEGWHMYSQFTSEFGGLPIEFRYKQATEKYDLVDGTIESKTFTEYSDIFGVDETFFKDNASFTQRIKVLDSTHNQIKVELFYQVCKDVCIPMDYTLLFTLDGSEAKETVIKVDDRSLALGQELRLDLKNRELLTQGQDNIAETTNIWVIFGLGFLGGLIALLTPCVFPMIPLTVSFFTKHSQNKSKGIVNALLYGFFIILIYFLLSLPFHLFDSVDSQILNSIATNVWLNLLFFVIFIFFAFSFFGYYELTLPNSWANKMDDASSKVGGVLGIFFMAVTLAIVSFSCTGPILGGLLGGTTLAEGEVATNLTAGMTGFGVALALPFALFALFPAWLNSLPKSGGWMTTVKVVLGFLEIGLALKFLSNADLVGHWGILKREIFLGIWIVLGIAMTLYLFGLYKFPHDGQVKKLSMARKVTAFISAAFTIYMILGVTNITNLKLLSGFPPPEFYSMFEQESDCPLGIDCFKDFNEGLAYAKEVNKPILLDFTGWACVNCRKMEENVWSDAEVFPIIKDNYVLISLYTDDREELPAAEQFNFQYDSGRVKEISNIAQKWGTFQDVNFSSISQPFYVLLSPDLKVLNTSIQNSDVPTYKNWLLEGLKNNN
ncbi:cytochrome c biogenesis protein CcdA [Maribacter sp. IgM3_T14_3]|uniref:protein-disulfide reductase DsbD family protein n=1 Tax=Maribacter sp. IgM3_T14_3 TaxID=3415140 RepID=UPI003C6EDAF0